MDLNCIVDAVHALYDDAALLSRDVILAQSLETFRGSMAAFTRCIEMCGSSPQEPNCAACNILVRLFDVTVERENSMKQEPFAFDETAVVLREAEHLARVVKASCDAALESIVVSASKCGIPAPTQRLKAIHHSNGSITEMSHSARESVAALQDSLGVFLKDVVKQYDVRIIAPVEVEKKLAVCVDQWNCFDSQQQQEISQCVAAELQCRLEWKWFSALSKELNVIAGGAGIHHDFVLDFEQAWLRSWNRRREGLQDQFSLLAHSTLLAARSAVARFPKEDVLIPDSHFVLDMKEQPPSQPIENRPVRLKQRESTVRDRLVSATARQQATRRPREALRRALDFSSPSAMLTVVSVNPDCDPLPPPQSTTPVIRQAPRSRNLHQGDPGPLVIYKLR